MPVSATSSTPRTLAPKSMERKPPYQMSSSPARETGSQGMSMPHRAWAVSAVAEPSSP